MKNYGSTIKAYGKEWTFVAEASRENASVYTTVRNGKREFYVACGYSFTTEDYNYAYVFAMLYNVKEAGCSGREVMRRTRDAYSLYNKKFNA